MNYGEFVMSVILKMSKTLSKYYQFKLAVVKLINEKLTASKIILFLRTKHKKKQKYFRTRVFFSFVFMLYNLLFFFNNVKINA